MRPHGIRVAVVAGAAWVALAAAGALVADGNGFREARFPLYNYSADLKPVAPQSANLQPAPPQTNNLGSFNITIVPGAGLSGNAPALAAFQRGAQAWASRISDPITVTINADLTAAGFPSSNIIGQTQSVSLQAPYDTIRNQVVADGVGQPNNGVVQFLPTAAQFAATLPAGRSLGANLVATKASLKALQFTGLDAAFGTSDGTITFNSAFNFDYDRSDGVGAGQTDFETVAAHEIGHLLGFTSAVDSVDATTAAQLPTVTPTTLDLFRFNRAANNPSTTAQFTAFPRDLTPGNDDATDDLTTENRMSTGVNGGDGRQASHWKADELTGVFIGIMDATLAAQQVYAVTEADYQAMNLIGYDVTPVPEPAACGLATAAAGAALAVRRRRRRTSGRRPVLVRIWGRGPD